MGQHQRSQRELTKPTDLHSDAIREKVPSLVKTISKGLWTHPKVVYKSLMMRGGGAHNTKCAQAVPNGVDIEENGNDGENDRRAFRVSGEQGSIYCDVQLLNMSHSGSLWADCWPLERQEGGTFTLLRCRAVQRQDALQVTLSSERLAVIAYRGKSR